MYYIYDIDGRYIGHTECDIESFSEYNHVNIAPPEYDTDPNNIFKPINWPYWTNNAWELRAVEE
jgi:hypothetical protein